jgi:RecA/RadA recombinase
MARTKVKAKKKAGKSAARTVKCGKCGDEGHNARGCDVPGAEGVDSSDDTEEETTETEPAAVETPAAAPAPEEVFDLSKAVKASDLKKAAKAEKPAKKAKPVKKDEEDEEQDYNGDPDYSDEEADADADDAGDAPGEHTPVPGLKPKIPKKKRERSKAELAFWKATEEKLAPNSMTSAGNLSLDIPRISTGNFGIDVGLYGGAPQGRFIRVTGLPKASKTGFCLNTVAQYQAHHCSECFGPKEKCKHDSDVPDVLWIDVEHRLSQMLRWVEAHGVNLECFRVMGPPSGQNVVDLVDHVIRSAPQAKIGLIVIDSLAHITSQDEINKATLDGPTIGRNAMLLNAAWRKWTSALHSLGIENQYKPTVLCINQIRHKVGVTYGSPETTPGGLGQDFASTVDIRFNANQPNFVVWNEKQGKFVVKQKGFKSTFKPSPDQTPDFMTVSWRVTASGHCPPGRSGEFNYWLKSAHGHRCGDPDNGLQLWEYSKRYNLIETEGQVKKLFDVEARTFDELMVAFRADPKSQRKAWVKIMEMLSHDAAR